MTPRIPEAAAPSLLLWMDVRTY